jgi:hypothetical protein
VSDGTAAGSELTVNGEKVTTTKDITRIGFYAYGGIVWSEDDVCEPYVSFSYDALIKEPNGMVKAESFTFSPTKEYPERKFLGPEKAAEEVKDSLIGKEPKIVTKILEFKDNDKVKRHIPDRIELLGRSEDSLKDLYNDIKSEIDG